MSSKTRYHAEFQYIESGLFYPYSSLIVPMQFNNYNHAVLMNEKKYLVKS